MRGGMGLMALWVACALIASGISVAAVSVVRATVQDSPVQVLTPAQVSAALAGEEPIPAGLAVASDDEAEAEDRLPSPSASRSDPSEAGTDDSGTQDRTGSDDSSGPGGGSGTSSGRPAGGSGDDSGGSGDDSGGSGSSSGGSGSSSSGSGSSSSGSGDDSGGSGGG